MPYFSIETNQSIDTSTTQEIMKKASAMIAGFLKKPESFVMVSIKADLPLMFGGTDEPTAFVRLKSIGLPEDRCPELSKEICDFLEQELKVQPNRVFIDFKALDRPLFGWNRKTF